SVVFGLDRADRNAACVAAAGGAVTINRVSPLRRRTDFINGALKSFGVGLVEIGLRDRRHRIGKFPRSARGLGGDAGDTYLLLCFTVEFFEIRIGDRPVDALAVGRLEGKVTGEEANARAEPVPSGVADSLDVGAFELVRSDLLVPIVRVVADRMHCLRG